MEFTFLKIHELKCYPEFFNKIKTGEKNFEIRLNDRDFMAGDHVYLEEFIPDSRYTYHWILVQIKYVTDFEQKPGWVVFGFREIARDFL